ncbi:GGDEF domain-containing protein, partial [Aeromonas veronii]
IPCLLSRGMAMAQRRCSTIGISYLEEQATLCRFGGEELVAIFEQTDIASAQQLMEQWRISMGQQDWREKGLSVSFSGGIAESLHDAPDSVMARADAALYQAKQAGKNRLQRA